MGEKLSLSKICEKVAEVRRNIEESKIDIVQFHSLEKLGWSTEQSNSLRKLQSQVTTLKENIKSLLEGNSELLEGYKYTASLEQERNNAISQVQILMAKQEEMQAHFEEMQSTWQGELDSERDHWKARYETVLSQLDDEKQEKFSLRSECDSYSQQLSEQSEYCASMGAASCTLLWRVSQCQESIQTILGGTKVEAFLSLAGSTIESYLETYNEETPEDSSEESQFVVALCGIVTNIAASSFGRDYLMKAEEGKQLVDTLISALTPTQSKSCVKMKNLILMALFNISIHRSGVSLLSATSNIVPALLQLVQDPSDAEIRLNSLRLIQSLAYDPGNSTLVKQIKHLLTPELRKKLSQEKCGDIRAGIMELITDLGSLNSEQ